MQFLSPGNNRAKNNVIVYFIFLIFSLLLFLPVLHKNFASDDFDVMYRVVYLPGIFMKGFFRPLSDVTLYFSYLTGGFNPFFYNLFNVVVHAGCCFLLYHFCLQYSGIKIKNRSLFAWSAAILFLIYPFHNETVIWVVGRASMVSCFFGFLSLVAAFSNSRPAQQYFLAALFYFLGLCSYETILPLPGIVLLLLYTNKSPLKKYLPLAAVYSVTLVVNLVVRYSISGVIYGSYGSKMFEPSLSGYGIKFLKVAGRLFLPPSDHPRLISGCFALLVLCIVWISITIIRKKNETSTSYVKISLALLVSCILPFMFGLNTRTFEGDRIFYFTSFFFCIWIAYLLDFFGQYGFSRLAGIAVLFYFAWFFYRGLFAWKKAGEITTRIVESVRQIRGGNDHLFIINLPEENNGAQIFRNGFMKALFINHVDTTRIKVINYISTENLRASAGSIVPVKQSSGIFIYPHALIDTDSIYARIHADINSIDSVRAAYKPADKIYYWNKDSLVLLNNTF